MTNNYQEHQPKYPEGKKFIIDGQEKEVVKWRWNGHFEQYEYKIKNLVTGIMTRYWYLELTLNEFDNEDSI